MTFEQILKIIRDPSKTDWQKAADLHAGVISGSTQSAFDVSQPIATAPRKARTIKPRPDNEPTSTDGEIG